LIIQILSEIYKRRSNKMTYIIKNEKLNGLGAVINECLPAIHFMQYRKEMAKNNISYKNAELQVPNLGLKKGWLFSNGEFWAISKINDNSVGSPSYCYLLNTKQVAPTLYTNSTRVPAFSGGNTIMPIQSPDPNREIDGAIPTPIRTPSLLPSRQQFKNCRIECDTPTNTVAGLGAVNLGDCFEDWEFNSFGSIQENGNFVDSDGKRYTTAQKTEWSGEIQYYVATTINGNVYYCPVILQPLNSDTGKTTPVDITTATTHKVPTTTPDPDEDCPLDCKEIEEEITFYLSETPGSVYEEITIQETKEICDTPPDSKEFDIDCDDIIEALKHKYPNIELSSLMGLAGLMGCGSKKQYSIVQGLGNAGSNEGDVSQTNMYAIFEQQMQALRDKIADVCPKKDITSLTDSDIATAIGQSIPVDIINDLPKIEAYLIANMNTIANNVCKQAKSKVNIAMDEELINGIPNWALYLTTAGLVGFSAYQYSQNKNSKKSKKKK